MEQSESRIQDVWSLILLFSLTVTFYLTKTGNRTKTSLMLYISVKAPFLPKNADCFQKIADISRIKGILVLFNILFKGTLIQISKPSNTFVFIWKYYVADFILKHLLLFQIWARKICEKFLYKHSETIEYVKN